MHSRKKPTPLFLIFLGVLMLGIFVPRAMGYDPIQIGVVVRLPLEITSHWREGSADNVERKLAIELAKSLNRSQPHWDFLPNVGPEWMVTIEAVALERGRNEIILRILFVKGTAQTGRGVIKLGESVLYEPAHFDVFGLPTPDEAEKDLWTKLESLLESGQQRTLRYLSRDVPLVQEPNANKIAGRTAVLPLPKARYEHLAWSKFRLCCTQQHDALFSTARNQWGQYNQSLLNALEVTIEGNDPTQDLKPVLVYLHEYIVNTTWLFLPGRGRNP